MNTTDLAYAIRQKGDSNLIDLVVFFLMSRNGGDSFQGKARHREFFRPEKRKATAEKLAP
jgi:hypothetical protein